MNKIALILALSLSVTACQKAPPAAAVEDGSMQTLEETQTEVPLAGTETPTENSMSESDLDNSSADMMNQQAADEAEEAKAEEAKEVFELVSESDHRFSIWRDKATGCEFIEKQDTNGYPGGVAIIFIPRPSGGAGQRGCKTGTDFK